jgi:hypothetical protein
MQYLSHVPQIVIDLVQENYDCGGPNQFSQEEIIWRTSLLNSYAYEYKNNILKVQISRKETLEFHSSKLNSWEIMALFSCNPNSHTK